MISFKPIKTPSTIIISRIDNIGDVIFTFPLVGILKKKYPQCRIYFLARSYIKDIANANPLIDGFLDWSALSALSDREAAQHLEKINADVIVNVFPDVRLAKLSKFAKIPFRVSRLTRLRHLLYSNKLKLMSRSDYTKHESELVNNLLSLFEIDDVPSIDEMHTYIQLNAPTTHAEKIGQFLQENKFNLIVHPGSNGNGREWPTNYFTDFINKLDHTKYNVILTGTSSEKERFQQTILDQCKGVTCSMGALSLDELIQLIAQSDGFIGSGTGPTHLAAALNVPTLGLFPKLMKVGVDRWKPLGKKVDLLVSEDVCDNCIKRNKKKCTCMNSITPNQVAKVVSKWHQEHNRKI